SRNTVVLRSSERLIDDMNRPLWETKWMGVHQTPKSPATKVKVNPIYWINCQEDFAGVYAKLIGLPVVCLGLAVVPPLVLDPSNKEELFSKVIRTGTPIAFWPRGLPDSPEKLHK